MSNDLPEVVTQLWEGSMFWRILMTVVVFMFAMAFIEVVLRTIERYQERRRDDW